MTRILSKQKDTRFKNNFEAYRDRVIRMVNGNQELLKSSVFIDKKGIFHDDQYMSRFTLTGAMQTTNLDELSNARSYFYTKNGRLFKKDGNFILRGPRYLAAIDPSLSIPQKLAIYIEDLHEGIEYLKRLRAVSSNAQYKILAPILDYVKNSIITLINALLNIEKRIRKNIDDSKYIDLKEDAVKVGCIATYSFYLSLIGEFDFLSIEDELATVVETANRICEVLISEYKEYRLSPRDIVRPEASHPLILLSFAALMVDQIKDVNTIIGLPSGGTEIAFLVFEALSKRGLRKYDLLLLPISFHSMLAQFGEQSDPKTILPLYWQKHKEILKDRNILIVDDNASSGATLQAIYSSLSEFSSRSSIDVAVAEADINRTKLDLDDINKRSHYADLSVYKYSVGILPVSRVIWRKHDLKEVLEAYSIGWYYAKLANYSELLDKIKAEVFKEEAIQPFERLVAEREWESIESIESFRDTFLSNFYKIKIPWRGKTFPSVEHAYQSAKFDSNALSNMPASLWNEVEDLVGEHIRDVSNLFTTDCRSGAIKKVASLLAENKLIRDNWDEIRVGIMIELLVTKFSHRQMQKKLLSTGSKYLIEGNNWGDTFWGACLENGRYRGRNILGLILMNIRKKIKKKDI